MNGREVTSRRWMGDKWFSAYMADEWSAITRHVVGTWSVLTWISSIHSDILSSIPTSKPAQALPAPEEQTGNTSLLFHFRWSAVVLCRSQYYRSTYLANLSSNSSASDWTLGACRHRGNTYLRNFVGQRSSPWQRDLVQVDIAFVIEVQNRAARIITYSNYDVRSKDILNKLVGKTLLKDATTS